MLHHNLEPIKSSGKPIVLFDADGVLLNLMGKWLARYNADYQDTLCLEQITDWAAHQYTKPECQLKYYDYILEPGFMRDLEPIPGAQQGLEYLSRYIEPVVVTTVPGCAVADRIANLRELFPCIPEGNIIITSRKDLVAGPLLVEDAPKNVQHSRPYFILMDYPYNRGLPDFVSYELIGTYGPGVKEHPRIRVHSIWDMVDAIMDLYQQGALA